MEETENNAVETSAYKEIEKLIEKGNGIPILSMNGTHGYAWFSGGKVIFDSDGSGQVANGHIVWDKLGNLFVDGWILSNKEGNRIFINPVERSLSLMDSDNNTLGKWEFYRTGQGNVGSILSLDYKDSDNGTSTTKIGGGALNMEEQDARLTINSKALNIMRSTSSFEVYCGSVLELVLTNLPTNRDGLTKGQVYSDGGVLKVVQ